MSRLAIAFIEKVWRESIGMKDEEKKVEKMDEAEEKGTKLGPEQETFFMQEI